MPGAPRYAVLDVETTGLVPGNDRIVEVAVVTLDPNGYFLGEWTSRINPEGPVGATHIHGISQADVATAPTFATLAESLATHLDGALLVAHNAEFDLSFLNHEFDRAGWDVPGISCFCTMRAAPHFLPGIARTRLADCSHAIGRPLLDAHSALGDARAASWLLHTYLRSPLATHIGIPALLTEAGGLRWPTSASRPARQTTSDDIAAMRRSAAVSEWRTTNVQTPARVEALMSVLDRASLSDMLDQDAPEGCATYLETLAEVLEDGEITLDEADQMRAVAEAMHLTPDDTAKTHEAFVLALALEALQDGVVSHDERAELKEIARLLGVGETAVPSLLKRAEAARAYRMSHGLKELPADWAHGDPMRVGDRVVFTGCYDYDRERLESETKDLGVFVTSSVSSKTTILVSDGTMDGGKAARAREIGTRVVHPDVFLILRVHLQPALADKPKAAPVRTPNLPAAPLEPSATEVVHGYTPAEIRDWGRSNGWEVGVRGRIHSDLFAAFLEAQEV